MDKDNFVEETKQRAATRLVEIDAELAQLRQVRTEANAKIKALSTERDSVARIAGAFAPRTRKPKPQAETPSAPSFTPPAA